MLDQLRCRSPQFTAEAFLVEGRTTTDRLLCLHRICREHEIALPFILKPDVGQRGNGVRLIRSMRAALEYLQSVDAPVIVQRYVVGPCEAGVFYYRFRMNRGGTSSRSRRKFSRQSLATEFIQSKS